MSPGSINGGEPVIWLQTALPLPGAEDYILMISAHLDTVGFLFFFLLHVLGLCAETMRPCGKFGSKMPGMRFLPLPLFRHGHLI